MSKIIEPSNFPISAVEHDFAGPIDLDLYEIMTGASFPYHAIHFVGFRNGEQGIFYSWLYESNDKLVEDYDRLNALKYPNSK